MNIIWSPEALADLEEAVDFLVERNVPAAEKLATGIVALVERLAADELDGPEHIIGDDERVRGWPFPPFRVYYQRTPESFFVVRVYHQRREAPAHAVETRSVSAGAMPLHERADRFTHEVRRRHAVATPPDDRFYRSLHLGLREAHVHEPARGPPHRLRGLRCFL